MEPEGNAPGRLRPEMTSRRLLVLAFVRDYFARWGGSPSYGEIAAALGTNRTRVREAVKRLVRDGELLRGPGPRGLILPDLCTEAVQRLRAAGWRVDERARAVTQSTLLPGPPLDYRPAIAAEAGIGEIEDGSEEQGGARARARG